MGSTMASSNTFKMLKKIIRFTTSKIQVGSNLRGLLPLAQIDF